MKKTNLFNYIENKVFRDKLWEKGKTFSLVDENDKVFEAEEYGSYVDCQPKTGEEVIKIYDEYDTFLGKDEGGRAKQFFRIESSCFKELIEEKKNNPNCSYVTCVDELLEEGYVPEKISAILMGHKYRPARIASNVENFGARMLNFFEVPTMFCKKLYYNLSKDKKQVFLASVDYLKPNEIMMNLNTYMQQYVYKTDTDTIVRTRNVNQVISAYEKVFKAHYKKVEDEGFKLDEGFDIESELSNMREQVAYMFLVRQHAFGDSDFMARNLGVIINQKTNKISVAPAYDFEFFCNYGYNVGWKFKLRYDDVKNSVLHKKNFFEQYVQNLDDPVGVSLIKDVKEIAKTYPNALSRFIRKADELLQSVDGKPCKLDEFLDEIEVADPKNWINSNKVEIDSDSFKDSIEVSNKKEVKEFFEIVRDVCEVYANESQAEMSE